MIISFPYTSKSIYLQLAAFKRAEKQRSSGIEVKDHVVLVEKDKGQATCALARLVDFVNQVTLEEGYDKQACPLGVDDSSSQPTIDVGDAREIGGDEEEPLAN
jgi:hypothetical protein